jgi:hypothetical protein
LCSITDLEDDGIDLPDFDDRGCNTLTTIVVSEQDVIDILNILDPNKVVGPDIISNKMLIAVKFYNTAYYLQFLDHLSCH